MVKRILSGWEYLLVFSLFAFFGLLIFWPIFFGGVNLNGNLLTSFYPPYGENLPFKNTGWDQIRTYFPFYKFTLDSFSNFSIPLWNPYAFSGHPHLADFQSAVLYPLNIFGLFLPQIEFWHLLRISPTILGAFFTYLYLKNLKLSLQAAFFGAFTFGFSPFLITWGEEVVMSPHSVIWLPLILLGIDKFLDRGERKYLSMISIGVAFSLLGGYMQTSIYMGIFVFIYLIFKLGENIFLSDKGILLIVSCLLGVLVSAAQLIPSGELFFNSARQNVALTEKLYEFLIPPQALVTFLAPDFFGHPGTGNYFRAGGQYYEGILFVGILPLLFAFNYLTIPGKNKFRLLLIMTIAISLLTTIDSPISRLFLKLPIPFLSSSIPNRVLFLSAFAIALLAAFGMEKYITDKKRDIFKVLGGFLTVYLFLAGYAFLAYTKNNLIWENSGNAYVSLRNLAIPLLIFGFTSVLILVGIYKNNLKKVCAGTLIFVSIGSIFYFSYKYLSFSERKFVFPNKNVLDFIQKNQGYWRSWGFGSAYFENNFATQYNIFWPEGYDSLNNRSYAEFTEAMQKGGEVEQIFRSDAGLGRGEGFNLLPSEGRRRLLDLVGVKYVIAQEKDFELLESENFALVYDGGTDSLGRRYGVFENKTVLPRAFLASNYEGPPSVDSTNKKTEQIEKERRALIPKKLSGSDFDLKNVIVLEEPSPISAKFGDGSANIVTYEADRVVVSTQSDEAKLLFLSDNYYPGWKAKVDGVETKIFRANYTFRAVPVLAGEHVVEFYFDSTSFKVGVLISFVGIILLFVISRGRTLQKD